MFQVQYRIPPKNSSSLIQTRIPLNLSVTTFYINYLWLSMKKILLISFVFLSLTVLGQDTLKPAKNDTAHARIHKSCTGTHEFGGNITLLFKQIFDLSNNAFPTLPYDLTYKYISGNNAFRFGFGVLLNNSSVSTTTTTYSSASNAPGVPPGPDAIVPTSNNSYNTFYRIGWEHRYKLDNRFSVWWGLDVAGQFGNSSSVSSSVNNNLPTNYSYLKTTEDIRTTAIGGGPVAGIQFFIAKKLSLFTEIPLYYQYTYVNDVTDNYSDNLNNFGSGGTYVTTENKQTQITKGPKLTLTLPVTLYLALTF
jgi:hypothetical protein